MTVPEVMVQRDAAELAQSAAARLVTKIVEAQAARGSACVVLTGGRSGISVLAALGSSPARESVDWGALDLWWGDERFLPSGDPDRNDTDARRVLLDRVPLSPGRVHPFPGPDGPDGNDPEAAAERYAAELEDAERPGDPPGLPSFDVVLLGLGEDAHVASLFPGLPAIHEVDRTVVAVRGAPKPPPVRLTMTLPTLCSAAEVWLLAAGPGKAQAVRLVLGTAGSVQVPGAGARGQRRTLVMLDEAAAANIPAQLRRLASP